jgi:hypothetical protein
MTCAGLVTVRTALSSEGFTLGIGQATWLIPRWGITVAGQRRSHTGFATTTPAGGHPARAAYARRCCVRKVCLVASVRGAKRQLSVRKSRVGDGVRMHQVS